MEGPTGVWRERVGGGRVKLASIGVHACDWVTWHGVALNVSNNLRTFHHTVPCGIDGVTMSTVQRQCAVAGLLEPSFDAVRVSVVATMAKTFALEANPLPDELIHTLA